MKKIIAVCACPAGIAHTYMASENIETVSKQKGYEVKVETNGSSGVENRLTQEDIASADIVLVAADTKVEMERFRGKPVLEISVSDAVRKIEKVFNIIENDEIKIY